ncbi:hypothetical protein LTR37_000878 [Vermiconidia calcicola]|uniref:Uncharacterized protein n=1 Tax=Vermiconidia calcicola TaxID=1690605 RepID=A0ACC3NX26_9PEZI|nr:hypothetical protein LTR37_000878 [Vermiconidia calcicola]
MATGSTTTTLTADGPTPKVVSTALNYYLDPLKGGHTSYQIGVSDYYRRKFDSHTVEIQDIRGQEDQFKLDLHGFQHVKHASAEKDFDEKDEIKRIVYPETAQLIKDVTGASRVHVFSHITRKDSREEAERAVREDAAMQDGNAPTTKVVPARFIHVDFSETGSEQILRDNFDHEEGENLTKTRWAIINVWRPIKPVSKDPLAICDARTARDEDLMPVVSYLPPKGSGQYADVSGGEHFELYYKRFCPDEQWYFADRMEPDEVLMIKIFDSLRDGETARRCPHSAFTNPSTEADATRESIEVRCLVFFEDQKV